MRSLRKLKIVVRVFERGIVVEGTSIPGTFAWTEIASSKRTVYRRNRGAVRDDLDLMLKALIQSRVPSSS